MSSTEYNGVLFTALSRVCPGTYVAWPIGSAPKLPWFSYENERNSEVYADNSNYGMMPRYRVELLMKEYDSSFIERFEDVLSDIGTWKLYEADWLSSENCLYHDYRLTLLPNRKDKN